MNFVRYGTVVVNLESISYYVIDNTDPKDVKVNIAFIGDGTYSDWGLTLESDEAMAFVNDVGNLSRSVL